jgi:type VI secretion system secreted protein VgrG
MAVQTPLGKDKLLLLGFTYSEQLSRLYRMTVRVHCEDPQVRVEDLLGQNITVRVQISESTARYFNGNVTHVAQSANVRGPRTFVLTVSPHLWNAGLNSDCRIFQAMSTPDIIKKVLTERGVLFKDNLKGTYPAWEMCVQYRETDFNFLSRLMEQEGIYYAFEHADGKNVVLLFDAPGSHAPNPEFAELPYWPQEPTPGPNVIRDWRVATAQLTARVALRDFSFEMPDNTLEYHRPVEPTHVLKGAELYDYPGEYARPEVGKIDGEGDRYARRWAEEVGCAHRLLRGETECRSVHVGHWLKLTDPESYLEESLRCEYLVTGIELEGTAAPFSTTGSGAREGGPSFRCALSAIERKVQYRPARTTPKPTISGPQTATVVGPAGEEIYTDKYGRVKLKFHWDRRATADAKDSFWVRVAQVWAGRQYGAVQIPRIGEEVVVEFLEGDPDRPLVTGRVYNKNNMPPYELPTHKTKFSIKSRSSKEGGGFNELCFEDKKGEERVWVHAQKDMDIRVLNDRAAHIGHDDHLTVGHDLNVTVKNDRNEKVEANHHEQIVGDRSLKVDGKSSTEVGGTLSVVVGDNVDEEYKADQATKVAGELSIKAKTIILEGTSHITIKVGQSFIAIEASGITIGTTGTIELDAKQNIEQKATMNWTAEGQMNASLKGNMSAKVESSLSTDVKGLMTNLNGSAMLKAQGGVVMIN